MEVSVTNTKTKQLYGNIQAKETAKTNFIKHCIKKLKDTENTYVS